MARKLCGFVRVEAARTPEDIGSVVVAARPTGVVRVSDVAQVWFGIAGAQWRRHAQWRGRSGLGTVLGLRGADARSVVKAVKTKLKEIAPQLPKDVKIEIFYDRSELIGEAV